MMCSCGNTARYIDEDGVFTCAICPLKAGKDSIKLASVPGLLAKVRHILEWVDGDRVCHTDLDDLQTIVGRHSQRPKP